MKKLIAVTLSLVMLLSLNLAFAESAESAEPFARFGDRLFEFTSGAGGWGTEVTIGADGTFTGNYHDSEMGETGDGYPDGTVYTCLFHGQFTDPVKVDDYTWTAKVAVSLDEGQALEKIEDGIRFVLATPYGLEKAQEVTFYLPGKPVDQLPEGFMIWSHLQEMDSEAKTLPYFAIWSEADEAGFVTYPDEK